MKHARLLLFIAASLALAACGPVVKPPSKEERKAIQRAQTDLWNGTTEAQKRRIP
jgi:hypothetical protein